MPNEKDTRLDELKALENHCDGHGVGTDNPDHTIRAFIRNRRVWLNREFAPKPAATEPNKFIASTKTPAVTPAVPAGSRSFVAGK